MGLFGFGKKKDVVDLGERYRKQQAKLKEMQGEDDSSDLSSGSSDSSPVTPFGSFGIFGSSSSSSSSTSSSGYADMSSDSGDSDKRKKLAKRLMGITDKMEDLSNQIYHLQQRIEVLERKTGTGRV